MAATSHPGTSAPWTSGSTRTSSASAPPTSAPASPAAPAPPAARCRRTTATFPRRIIRYAQLGMKDALLSSKELWSCYQCGECAETCPTQADPVRVHGRRPPLRDRELRPDARRPDHVHEPDRRHGARRRAWPCCSPLFMLSARGPQDTETLAIFEFIPVGARSTTSASA